VAASSGHNKSKRPVADHLDGYTQVARYEIYPLVESAFERVVLGSCDYKVVFKIFCRAVFFRLLAGNFWWRISI
jgi:hypothetical protein